FAFGADRQFNRRLVAISRRQQIQRFLGRNVDFLGLGNSVDQRRIGSDGEVGEIAQYFKELAGQAVAGAKPPWPVFAAAHRTEDEWNPERAHEAGRAQSREGDVMNAVEFAWVERSPHEPRGEKLPD